jgi:starch synthase
VTLASPNPSPNLSILISHLTGSANSRQAALAFHEVNQLAECHHTLAWSKPPLFGNLWPPSLRSQIQRRCFPNLPRKKLRTHPWPEIIRLVSRSNRIPILANWLRKRFDIAHLNQGFDAAVARRLPHAPGLKAVYGYFDTSLQTFRAAKSLGLTTIYELPTPYWRYTQKQIDLERTRQGVSPWAATLPSEGAFENTAASRDEELQLADIVIVPSQLVRASLELAPSFKAPVIVIPYGCPEPTDDPVRTKNSEPRTQNSAPLKLLFVGTLSQSKGLADLLEAIIPFGDQVQLTLAGSSTSPSPISHLPSSIRQLGQLPHTELLAELPNHDLLVLPTLYEGLSLSILEAMSAGLPVLTTTHSGMKGLIENERQILMVEPRSPEELRGAIQHLLHQPEDRERLSREGLQWAKAHGWGEYRKSLINVIETHLQESPCSQGR